MMSLFLALLLVSGQTTPRDRSEAYYHFSLGLQALLDGEPEPALSEFRRAEKLDPASSEVRVEIAKLLRGTGQNTEALTKAREAVKLGPDNPDAHILLGRLLQIDGDGVTATLQEAAAEYEAAVQLRPGDVATLGVLAELYGQLSDHKAAAVTWEKVVELEPEEVEAHLNLAGQYLEQGDTGKATVAVGHVLDLKPSSPRVLERVAEVYARAQQTDQAILHFRKALELEPENPVLHLSLGDVLFRSRRYDEVLVETAAVLTTDPKNPRALDLKARSLRELRRYDEATEVVSALLAQNPGDLKAAFLKVTVAEAQRDFATAESALQEILARPSVGGGSDDANNRRVFLFHLGYVRQQMGRFAEAADAFTRAKATGGEPDETLLGYLVDTLIASKDYDRALAEARAARTRFPETSSFAIQEANALREKGETQAAFEIVEDLERRAPKELETLQSIGQFYQRARRYNASEAAMRQALELDPKDLRTLFSLGASLERQKRHDDAEAVFRQALAVRADSAPVLNYLGYMNADRGVRVEEALSLIERALALEPENGAYLDSRGWALFRLDRFAQAEESFRKALLKDHANAVILDHLGDTLRQRGRIEEALELWRQALQGEDEDGELDRALVEKKIREAQSNLASKDQRPPDPKR